MPILLRDGLVVAEHRNRDREIKPQVGDLNAFVTFQGQFHCHVGAGIVSRVGDRCSGEIIGSKQRTCCFLGQNIHDQTRDLIVVIPLIGQVFPKHQGAVSR